MLGSSMCKSFSNICQLKNWLKLLNKITVIAVKVEFISEYEKNESYLDKNWYGLSFIIEIIII